jgi:hypothetical protein
MWLMRPLRRLVIAAFAACAASCLLLATATAPARAGTVILQACSAYADTAANETEVNDAVVENNESTVPVWQGWSTAPFAPSDKCGTDSKVGSFQINPASSPHKGATGHWQTRTPAQVEIVSANVPADWILVEPYLRSDGYAADFFWDGSSQSITPGSSCCGGMDYAAQGINRSIGPSRWFGFEVRCEASTCNDAPTQILDVRGVQLVGEDNASPTLTPLGQNILYANGAWIRGSGWSASFQASADDGICDMAETVDGAWVQGPYDTSPNHGSWTQCPTPQSQYNTIDTDRYANGALSIAYAASDAASPANVAKARALVYVDNVTPTVGLSGPAYALSSAGTQYVTVTAGAGPSGVAAIFCSLDSGPWQRYAAATAQVPVAGVGEHAVSCYATNHAIDPSGQPATSPLETFHIDIQEPTVSSISFARIADALRCHRSHRRILIPAQTVTEHYHHHKIRVRIRAHHKWIKTLHCHARVVHEHIRVGHRWVTRRVVLLPHAVRVDFKRVPFGRSTTVSGWLGTSGGDAIGRAPVEILTAPDDGSDRFSVVATTTTQESGDWQVRLRPGPSRLVEAAYPGSPTLAATTSAPVTLTVPASLSLSIRPRDTHWTGTIRISGRLRGGYIPPSGELVVLKVGWRGGSAEIGHLYVGAGGRFNVRYTFLRGSGSETYRIWASSVRESDYPYAPASSRRVWVDVR